MHYHAFVTTCNALRRVKYYILPKFFSFVPTVIPAPPGQREEDFDRDDMTQSIYEDSNVVCRPLLKGPGLANKGLQCGVASIVCLTAVKKIKQHQRLVGLHRVVAVEVVVMSNLISNEIHFLWCQCGEFVPVRRFRYIAPDTWSTS